jgi:hypothetical protein
MPTDPTGLLTTGAAAPVVNKRGSQLDKEPPSSDLYINIFVDMLEKFGFLALFKGGLQFWI